MLTCLYFPYGEPTEDECLSTQSAVEYNGTANTVASGQRCSSWSNLEQSLYNILWYNYEPDKAKYVHNFCRNIDADEHGPWCYTDVSREIVEYCLIPKCCAYEHRDI